MLRGQPTSLSLRVASGIVAVPTLLGVALLGGPVYGAVVALAAALGAWEMRAMLRASGRHPLDLVLVGVSTFLPFHAALLTPRQGGTPVFGADGMVVVGVSVVGSLLLLMLRGRLDGALDDWAVSIASAFYLGGLLQFFAPLRDRPDGAFWVMALLGLSWVCDSTAYFVGRAVGRRRLAPAISPKKSVEGAVAGLVGAMLVAVLVGLASGRPAGLLAGYGLVIGAATILGDLAESLLKRQTGVKDSGMLVPGHGGILDRMDSLLFCAPMAVLYLLVFARP